MKCVCLWIENLPVSFLCCCMVQIVGSLWKSTLILFTIVNNDFGPENEVALLMRLENTGLCLGPITNGHYNEVVLLKRWP